MRVWLTAEGKYRYLNTGLTKYKGFRARLRPPEKLSITSQGLLECTKKNGGRDFFVR